MGMHGNIYGNDSMFAFVARQPILDRDKELYAYELLFRDGQNGCLPEYDAEKAQYIANKCLRLGLDEISCDKTSFVNINRETLLHRFPSNLDPKTVVVEIAGNTQVNQGLLDACKHIRMLGYQLAINAPRLEGELTQLLPLIDIVKVDINKISYADITQNIPALLGANVKLVADQVETQQDFGICRDLGFDFFQGYFFSRPADINNKPLPATKATLVELIKESSSSEFNIDNVNLIIERDAALSYMLLRFINNPTVNKRYKISSLRHALTYMGEVEIKKFIALLALANLGDNKPMELIHLALVRARFCDLMAQQMSLGDNPPTGFLVGLFSLLDGLLDQEMEYILEQIPLVNEVKDALLGKQNQLSEYLQLTRCFESATWLRVKQICNSLNIEQKLAHSLFNQAIVWGNSVRRSISPHFPESKA